MSNLLSGLNTALQTMLANQAAIQTVEHNVANANVPGYHRQEAPMQAARAYAPAGLYTSTTSAGQIGAGVIVDKITRFKQEIFDASFRNQSAQAAYWTEGRDWIGQIENRMGELGDTGLPAQLDAFWAGWRGLESDPTNPTLRAQLLERSNTLATAFNQRTQTLDQMRREMDGSVATLVGQINTAAKRVAQLNGDIGAVQATGQEPNDLMDERDRLIEDLARMTGAESHLQDNGQVLVSIRGQALVVGSKSFDLQAQRDSGAPFLTQISWVDHPEVDFSPPKSQLAAVLDGRDEWIVEQQNGLDALANTLATWVNGRHTAGFDLNGDPGVNFFSGSGAAHIGVNQAIQDDPNLIAAAGSASAPGDGSNAAALANLQFEGEPAGNTVTINDLYHQQITGLGLKLQSADKQAGAHELLIQALEQQRQSVSGVSLDEEAANLVKFQRTYQAAARLMTAVDEMLDRVINGMGRVGL